MCEGYAAHVPYTTTQIQRQTHTHKKHGSLLCLSKCFFPRQHRNKTLNKLSLYCQLFSLNVFQKMFTLDYLDKIKGATNPPGFLSFRAEEKQKDFSKQSVNPSDYVSGRSENPVGLRLLRTGFRNPSVDITLLHFHY